MLSNTDTLTDNESKEYDAWSIDVYTQYKMRLCVPREHILYITNVLLHYSYSFISGHKGHISALSANRNTTLTNV